MFFRAFCRSATELAPAALAEHLHAAGLAVVPHFTGDALGWTEARLTLPGGGSPVPIARYLTADDNLRKDLNGFAAEVEAMDFYPGRYALMERVIQTQQLVVVRRPLDHADETTLDRLCWEVVRLNAEAGDGLVQIDGRGWLTPSGEVLVSEY